MKHYRYLFYCIRDYFRLLPVISVLSVIIFPFLILDSIMPLVTTRFIQSAQDVLNGLQSSEALWNNTILFCVVLIIPTIFSELNNIINALSEVKCCQLFGGNIFGKTKKISLISFEDSNMYDKYCLANKAASGKNLFHGNAMHNMIFILFRFMQIGFSVVFAVTALALFSYWLVFLAVLSSALSIAISVRTSQMRISLRHTQAPKTRQTEYFWELFCKKETVKEMQVMGFADYFQDRWMNSRDEMLEEEISIESKIRKYSNLGDIIKNLFYGINIAISIILILYGNITIAQFAGCLSAFAVLQNSINVMVSIGGDAHYVFSLVEDYYEFMDLPEEVDGYIEYKKFKRNIQLKNVYFSYPNSNVKAINGIDLEIKRGECVVVVGENGSGKTTLSKLITGCYKAQGGNILFDGKEIYNLKIKTLLKNITMVSQNFIKYNLSLKDNIVISNILHINNENMIKDVIARVGLTELTDEIGGIDMQLGKEFGGYELSEGQWQKIAIARAIFKDSDIIILDEPTSALDPLVEYEILNQFMDITNDKTSIIISHRVGICTKADKIIVMQSGKIIECGNHHELLQMKGEYYKIWSSQARWIT